MLIVVLCLFMINFTEVKSSFIVGAGSAVLMEKETKRILYEKDAHKEMLTASICKVLTAITALEWGDLDKECLVTKEATMQQGSSIYLKVGDYVSLKTLIYGLILRSGNDAAYLIACNVCDNYQDFIDKMNFTAQKIGMKNSRFSNPSGLDDDSQNYSTAYDMALLMAYALDNKTYREINSTKKIVLETKSSEKLYFINKHKLIQSMDYVIAGKTGYTKDAKRTLITAGEKENMTLIAVTFSCSNDWNEHIRLFDYGFDNYQNITLFKKGILELDYPYTVYCPVDISYPVSKEETLDYEVILLSKVKKEIVIGKVNIIVNNKKVKDYSLYRYY